MITLAHISDIHLSPLPQVGLSDLFGKRLTGFLNWKLKRHGEMNIGTLARSADAFGATALVVTGHAADPYDPQAVRASTGSLFALTVLRVPAHGPVVDYAHANGYRIIGTDEHGSALADAPLDTGRITTHPRCSARSVDLAAMVDREDCLDAPVVIDRVRDPVVAAIGTVRALELEAKLVTDPDAASASSRTNQLYLALKLATMRLLTRSLSLEHSR